MAGKRVDAPSRPWAQGEFARLLLGAPPDPRLGEGEPAARVAIAAKGKAVAELVTARRAKELERNVAARELAEANVRKAELVPRHAKLVLQAEGLKRSQLATPDLERQRRLRRERAELSVRIDDLSRNIEQQDRIAGHLRNSVHAADRFIADNEHEGFVARGALDEDQRAAAPLAAYLAPLEHSLALASCQFYLSNEPAEARAALLASRVQVADKLLALCADMARGMFGEQEVAAFAGGRHPLLAELSWGLLALGDDGRLLALHEAMTPAPMSHQIFAVFRAFLPALLRRNPSEALGLAIGAHRFSQGLRGALAEAAFCLVADDAVGFAESLKTVAPYDWRQGQQEGMAAFGLVSMAAAGLARLGLERGYRLPVAALAPLAPPVVWQPAPAR